MLYNTFKDDEPLLKYRKYKDMFLKIKLIKLLALKRVVYLINLKEEKSVPFNLIYILFINKLRVLYEYIKTSMIKG